jgi:hypothetical protein
MALFESFVLSRKLMMWECNGKAARRLVLRLIGEQ